MIPHALTHMIDRLEPDEALLLPVPYGLPQRERQLLFDHFAEIVGELRDAGHQLDVRTVPTPEGECLALSMKEMS